MNSLDDFCLWAPPRPGDVVGNIEGEMVAWCTKGDLHGARQIPAGALTGVQFMKVNKLYFPDSHTIHTDARLSKLIQTPRYVQGISRVSTSSLWR